MTETGKTTFYEFFAGGGMARAGLGSSWRCVFANDFDFKKGVAYQTNWDKDGQTVLKVGDIRKVETIELPGTADLAWASFPCQDLSLAGGGAGLRGERSGTFYPFWDIVKLLIAEGRAPRVVALENVTGTLTSHGGKDFEAICQTFAENGYRVRRTGDRRSALCSAIPAAIVRGWCARRHPRRGHHGVPRSYRAVPHSWPAGGL